jgi:AcrR family transcriptional regulator
MSDKKFIRDRQEKIDIIYDTFFNLVLKNGYHKTSTNHVAKEAGLSIGTIYRYFPNGREDIISKFFRDNVEATLNLEDFKDFDAHDISSPFKVFIKNVLDNTKQNMGYSLAFAAAIQTDKDLLEKQNERIIQISREFMNILRETNEFFKSRPADRLLKGIVFTYNLIKTIIYQHLFIMPFFEKDDDLIDYIANLLTFTINYLQKIEVF